MTGPGTNSANQFETANGTCAVSSKGLTITMVPSSFWARLVGRTRVRPAVVIARGAIVSIVAHPPQPRISRGYFEVMTNITDRPDGYVIVVRGSDQPGGTYDRARQLLLDHGYLYERCRRCNHVLLPHQNVCPECGAGPEQLE